MTESPPFHVLVLDDDPVYRPLVHELLTEEGCTVTTAGTGGEALVTLEQCVRSGRGGPDVVLTDWRLPDMDGRTFIGRYHALPGPHAPVVVVTADSGAARRATAVGASAVLEKPFDLSDLLDLLARYTPCIAG